MKINRAISACLERGRNRPIRGKSAFTLLEVMVALGIVGIALVPLLSLERRNLESVVRARETACAALLAQELIARAELEKFPALGVTRGDFESSHPGQYSNFRWERIVEPSPLFGDLRKVTVRVIYGSGYKRSFTLIEFLHSPLPLVPRG